MLSLLKNFLEMVRFSHTLFAMPFALAAMLWAAGGLPDARTFWLIVAAMVFCRNAAMAFNRLVDARIDARNPRTQNRHLPAGILSHGQVIGFLVLNAVGFVASAMLLNHLALLLSLPTLLVTFFYSLTKRFTSYSHLFLGFAIGISPMGAWVAVTGTLGMPAVWLGLALMLWISGFDIIYATQDADFDRRQGLHSLVVRFGTQRALRISLLLHAAMASILWWLGFSRQMGGYYYLGVGVVTILMFYLHFRRRSNSLDGLNHDFFLANIAVSVCLLLGIGASVLLGSP